MTIILTATFGTRRDAEMTVERLVQEFDVDRAAISVGTEGDRNSAGENRAGFDNGAGQAGQGDRDDAALSGAVIVTVEVADEAAAETVRSAFGEFDALGVVETDRPRGDSIGQPFRAMPPRQASTPTNVVDRARDLAPTLFMGAVAAGAAAVVAAVVVRSRREATAAKPRADKTAKVRSTRTSASTRSATPKSVTGEGTAKTRKTGAKRSKAVAAGTAPAKRMSRVKADDKAIRGPQDASRIAMGEAYEVRYWTGKFGVDREALQHAVDAVGSSADAVERDLRGSKSPALGE